MEENKLKITTSGFIKLSDFDIQFLTQCVEQMLGLRTDVTVDSDQTFSYLGEQCAVMIWQTEQGNTIEIDFSTCLN